MTAFGHVSISSILFVSTFPCALSARRPNVPRVRSDRPVYRGLSAHTHPRAHKCGDSQVQRVRRRTHGRAQPLSPPPSPSLPQALSPPRRRATRGRAAPSLSAAGAGQKILIFKYEEDSTQSEVVSDFQVSQARMPAEEGERARKPRPGSEGERARVRTVGEGSLAAVGARRRPSRVEQEGACHQAGAT